MSKVLHTIGAMFATESTESSECDLSHSGKEFQRVTAT